MKHPDTPLQDVLSTDIVCIHPEDQLREALAVMVGNRVSVLPVIDAQRHCVGILSMTDLLAVTKDLGDELQALSKAGELDHQAFVERLAKTNLLVEPVKNWMSLEPVTVSIDSNLKHAAQLMLRNQVHRLVVLDRHERVIGIVSTMDLLAAFAGEG